MHRTNVGPNALTCLAAIRTIIQGLERRAVVDPNDSDDSMIHQLEQCTTNLERIRAVLQDHEEFESAVSQCEALRGLIESNKAQSTPSTPKIPCCNAGAGSGKGKWRCQIDKVRY